MTCQQVIKLRSLSSAVKAIKLIPIIKRGKNTEVGNYQLVSVLVYDSLMKSRNFVTLD